MDADLISYEAMLAAQEAAKSAYWTMIFTGAGVAFSIVTVLVAIYGASVARQELSSWKEQQKLLQLVRLKRSVFTYRQKLEANISRSVNDEKFNEILRDELQPFLADIYHELVVAGLDSEEYEEAIIFRQLMDSHNLHMDGKAKWSDVYDKVAKLQLSIKVSL